MAKFKFRLQSYLNVKEKLEEQKKLEFGKAVQQLEIEKRKKKKLENSLYTHSNELRQEIKTGISPADFKRYKQYLVFLEEEIKKQNIHVINAQKNAEKKREELLLAVQNRKMLDTLKDKDYEEFLIELNKEEQKMVDEITSYRYQSR